MAKIREMVLERVVVVAIRMHRIPEFHYPKAQLLAGRETRAEHHLIAVQYQMSSSSILSRRKGLSPNSDMSEQSRNYNTR